MTTADIERLKQILEQMRLESIQSLRNGDGRPIVSLNADTMDQTRALADQDLNSRTISMVTARLRGLEEALRAIREGTFGRCKYCDTDIPMKRLEAVPWSQACVECQTIGEMQESRKERQGEVSTPFRARMAWRGGHRMSGLSLGPHPSVLRRDL